MTLENKINQVLIDLLRTGTCKLPVISLSNKKKLEYLTVTIDQWPVLDRFIKNLPAILKGGNEVYLNGQLVAQRLVSKMNKSIVDQVFDGYRAVNQTINLKTTDGKFDDESRKKFKTFMESIYAEGEDDQDKFEPIDPFDTFDDI